MHSESSIYSYIINVLTLAKVYKTKLSLNDKVQDLDKIIDLSLKALDDFEELDTFNPHQKLSLKIKCIIENDEKELLIKEGKKQDEIISFSPSLSLSFKQNISEFINKNLANPTYSYKICDLLNLADLKENGIVKNKVKMPVYILIVKINVNSCKIIGKGFKFSKEISNFDKLDKYILSRGE